LITLYPPPALSLHVAYKQKNKLSGRKRPFTSRQVTLETQQVMDGGLSSQAWRALDLLAAGGALDLNRLGVTDRTMRNWASSFLTDRIQVDRVELQAKYDEIGLTGISTYLYTLGPVGREIAAQRHGQAFPGIYHGWRLDRILHDLVANEIVFRLAEAFGAQGWAVQWVGAHECALMDAKTQTAILTPGGLLHCRKDDGQKQTYLLEYHNEDGAIHATKKAREYQSAFESGVWKKQWKVETFPPVLTVFQDVRVGDGYRQAVRSNTNCSFYGKRLKAILEGNIHEWFFIAGTLRRVALIPQG